MVNIKTTYTEVTPDPRIRYTSGTDKTNDLFLRDKVASEMCLPRYSAKDLTPLQRFSNEANEKTRKQWLPSHLVLEYVREEE